MLIDLGDIHLWFDVSGASVTAPRPFQDRFGVNHDLCECCDVVMSGAPAGEVTNLR